MAEKKKRQEIAEWLYERTTNTSSKVLTKPSDNENILKPVDISTINTGKDFLKKNMFVRLRFVGSDKFYEMFFQNEDSFSYWNKIIDELKFDDDKMEDNEEIPKW